LFSWQIAELALNNNHSLTGAAYVVWCGDLVLLFF
jgi:hypothetical protein